MQGRNPPRLATFWFQQQSTIVSVYRQGFVLAICEHATSNTPLVIVRRVQTGLLRIRRLYGILTPGDGFFKEFLESLQAISDFILPSPQIRSRHTVGRRVGLRLRRQLGIHICTDPIAPLARRADRLGVIALDLPTTARKACSDGALTTFLDAP